MAMNHLTTFVPEKLNVDAMNYSSWMYYFSHLCYVYGILVHLVDSVASSSTATPTDPPPKDAEWTKIDFIIRSWIFSTLAPSLRKRLVNLNPTTAKDAWTYIADIFQDNKRPRAMALKAKLCNLKLGDLSSDGSFLTTHEMRLKSRVQNHLVDSTFASPMVLLDKSKTNAWRAPSLEKVNNPCWSFAKGSCRFGDACNYFHNGVHSMSTLLPCTSGSASSVPDVTRLDLDMLQSLLAKFGLNAPNTSTPFPPVAYTVYVSPGFPSVSTQLSVQPTYHGGCFPGSVHLGQSPSMPFHLSQLFASGSHVSGQATLFPNAFNTTTLQDPAFVGDGRFILVTNCGHSVLSTPFRTLRLNNEFITRRVLLSCDSTGDLYPVTKPSTIPHGFLTSQYTWHQRLGHPGSKVLCHLMSSDSISYNKEKLPVLCHACQLASWRMFSIIILVDILGVAV
nr:ribonuclease H-like domain-containing protein [Tanacetum cinerariifolium]